MASSTYFQNYAGFIGGGLNTVGKAKLTSHDTHFMQNEAATSGVAMYLGDHSLTTVHGGTYTRNHAQYGAGVYCYGCLLTTTSTACTNNTAAQYGGGLHAVRAAQVRPIAIAKQKVCCMS